MKKRTSVFSDATSNDEPLSCNSRNPSELAGVPGLWAGSLAGSKGQPQAKSKESTPSSMASPVRRHLVNPKGSNNGSLATSIDTLDLGLFVTWENPEISLERLREMKLAAQATHVLQDTSIPGREHLHFSKCSKTPNYAFIQQFPEYFRFIASSEVHGKSPVLRRIEWVVVV